MAKLRRHRFGLNLLAYPDRVRDAVAGFALTVRCGPATAPQIAVK